MDIVSNLLRENERLRKELEVVKQDRDESKKIQQQLILLIKKLTDLDTIDKVKKCISKI